MLTQVSDILLTPYGISTSIISLQTFPHSFLFGQFQFQAIKYQQLPYYTLDIYPLSNLRSHRRYSAKSTLRCGVSLVTNFHRQSSSMFELIILLKGLSYSFYTANVYSLSIMKSTLNRLKVFKRKANQTYFSFPALDTKRLAWSFTLCLI